MSRSPRLRSPRAVSAGKTRCADCGKALAKSSLVYHYIMSCPLIDPTTAAYKRRVLDYDRVCDFCDVLLPNKPALVKHRTCMECKIPSYRKKKTRAAIAALPIDYCRISPGRTSLAKGWECECSLLLENYTSLWRHKVNCPDADTSLVDMFVSGMKEGEKNDTGKELCTIATTAAASAASASAEPKIAMEVAAAAATTAAAAASKRAKVQDSSPLAASAAAAVASVKIVTYPADNDRGYTAAPSTPSTASDLCIWESLPSYTWLLVDNLERIEERAIDVLTVRKLNGPIYRIEVLPTRRDLIEKYRASWQPNMFDKDLFLMRIPVYHHSTATPNHSIRFKFN